MRSRLTDLKYVAALGAVGVIAVAAVRSQRPPIVWLQPVLKSPDIKITPLAVKNGKLQFQFENTSSRTLRICPPIADGTCNLIFDGCHQKLLEGHRLVWSPIADRTIDLQPGMTVFGSLELTHEFSEMRYGFGSWSNIGLPEMPDSNRTCVIRYSDNPQADQVNMHRSSNHKIDHVGVVTSDNFVLSFRGGNVKLIR